MNVLKNVSNVIDTLGSAANVMNTYATGIVERAEVVEQARLKECIASTKVRIVLAEADAQVTLSKELARINKVKDKSPETFKQAEELFNSIEL